MANSKYEYVKQYEQDAALLPSCYIVVRVDGKGFTKWVVGPVVGVGVGVPDWGGECRVGCVRCEEWSHAAA